jgi:hypothetical protein
MTFDKEEKFVLGYNAPAIEIDNIISILIATTGVETAAACPTPKFLESQRAETRYKQRLSRMQLCDS